MLFNLLTPASNLPNGAFSLPTRALNLATRAFCVPTRGFELVTRNSCFTFPLHVWKDDFKILNGSYKSSIKRKISEALYTRALKPTLNVKGKSIKFELYN